MRFRGAARATAIGLAIISSVVAPLPGQTSPQGSSAELVGAFVAEAPLTGAKLSGDRLYLTSLNHLSIYDVSTPTTPVLVGSAPSPHLIHGELISTDDRLLLLNDTTLHSLDIWDVEDERNPEVVATVPNLPDEHFSCLLSCRWVYGSAGTILDVSRPSQPVKEDLNWKRALGLPPIMIHRVDEYDDGYIVSAPRPGAMPVVIDARRPLDPKLIARAVFPPSRRRGFLYSTWPGKGTSRYLFSSVEYSNSRNCEGSDEGALIAFDTEGWPRKTQFQEAARYKLRGAGSEAQDCAGYYFSLHPKFDETGLILVPYGSEGARIVQVDSTGLMREVTFFEAPVSDVWHALWVSDTIFYSANFTGEVYILRYEP